MGRHRWSTCFTHCAPVVVGRRSLPTPLQHSYLLALARQKKMNEQGVSNRFVRFNIYGQLTDRRPAVSHLVSLGYQSKSTVAHPQLLLSICAIMAPCALFIARNEKNSEEVAVGRSERRVSSLLSSPYRERPRPSRRGGPEGYYTTQQISLRGDQARPSDSVRVRPPPSHRSLAEGARARDRARARGEATEWGGLLCSTLWATFGQ